MRLKDTPQGFNKAITHNPYNPLEVCSSGEIWLLSTTERNLPQRLNVLRHTAGMTICTWSEKPALYTPDGTRIFDRKLVAKTYRRRSYKPSTEIHNPTVLIDYDHNLAVPLYNGDDYVAAWMHEGAVPTTNTYWCIKKPDTDRVKAIRAWSREITNRACVMLDLGVEITRETVCLNAETRNWLQDIFVNHTVSQLTNEQHKAKVLDNFSTQKILSAAILIGHKRFMDRWKKNGNVWADSPKVLDIIIKQHLPAKETHYKYLMIDPNKERTW